MGDSTGWGRRLAELRRAKGLRQRDVAEATGWRAGRVADIETKGFPPGILVVERYLDALGYVLAVVPRADALAQRAQLPDEGTLERMRSSGL